MGDQPKKGKKMADYCIGSTGVAQLHISFAKPKDLVQLPVQVAEQGRRNYVIPVVPRKRKLNSEERYMRFEEFMDKKLRGRTKISGSEMNEILAQVAKSLSMKVASIRNTLLKRYYKGHDVTVTAGFNHERSLKYQHDYKRFKEVRDKYPEISATKRQKLFEKLAAELHLSVKTLSGERYEVKWRKEYETE